jgi:hypothetical protein
MVGERCGHSSPAFPRVQIPLGKGQVVRHVRVATRQVGRGFSGAYQGEGLHPDRGQVVNLGVPHTGQHVVQGGDVEEPGAVVTEHTGRLAIMPPVAAILSLPQTDIGPVLGYPAHLGHGLCILVCRVELGHRISGNPRHPDRSWKDCAGNRYGRSQLRRSGHRSATDPGRPGYSPDGPDSHGPTSQQSRLHFRRCSRPTRGKPQNRQKGRDRSNGEKRET